MVALRRVDVADLNARARQRMRAAGALGPEELELRAGGFSGGDHVLIRQNHLGLGIRNGQRGVVVGVDVIGRSLELDIAGRRVGLGADFLDASTRRGDPTLTHGYAITGHAAQGTTVDHAFVLADPSLSREWGYTALTRGRESNHLYVAATRQLWRDEFAPHDPEPPDPIAQLVGALSKGNAQTLAIDASPLMAAVQELRRLEAERAKAVRDEAEATRARWAFEQRAHRWRPRAIKALDTARVAESAAKQRAGGLRAEEQRQTERVRALRGDRLDRPARSLQRRLEREQGLQRSAER